MTQGLPSNLFRLWVEGREALTFERRLLSLGWRERRVLRWRINPTRRVDTFLWKRSVLSVDFIVTSHHSLNLSSFFSGVLQHTMAALSWIINNWRRLENWNTFTRRRKYYTCLISPLLRLSWGRWAGRRRCERLVHFQSLNTDDISSFWDYWDDRRIIKLLVKLINRFAPLSRNNFGYLRGEVERRKIRADAL